jgi:hypothetical protein
VTGGSSLTDNGQGLDQLAMCWAVSSFKATVARGWHWAGSPKSGNGGLRVGSSWQAAVVPGGRMAAAVGERWVGGHDACGRL